MIVIGLLVFALVLWLFFASRKRTANAAALAARSSTEQEAFQAAQEYAATCDFRPITVSGVIPQKGERFYLSTPFVGQIIEQKTTEYQGRSRGASLYVGHGVTLRSGASHGQRVVHSAMVVADAGTLFFSNKRVVFVGAKNTVTVTLSHIVSATDYLDALRIDRTAGAPLWFRTEKQNLGVYIRRIMTATPVPN
jgi:hypothetical protein